MHQVQHIPGIVMAFGLLLAGLAPGAQPQPVDATDSRGGEHELSRSQAAALVQGRYAARVVRVSSADEGGRHIYVFRLLSEAGKVWQVRIDARSGAEIP
jgi:uncharacterized membrane protein YkoI